MNYKKGILLAFVTALISGVSIFYNKIIIVSGVEPLVLNIFKNGTVALVLSLLLFRSLKFSKLAKLHKTDWIKLLGIAVIGGSIPFILYFEGLKYVSATNANLIHKTLFIWVAALALPILGEKLNLWQAAGYILLFFGNVFLGLGNGFKFGTGELLIFSATLLWGLENILAKIILKRTDPKIVAWARMFLGTLIMFGFAAFQNKTPLLMTLDQKYLFPIITSGLFLTGYVLSYFHALKYAPATLVTSILILATPVTNILYSTFVLHNFSTPTSTNLLLTLVGILLIMPSLSFLKILRFKK